MNKQLLFNVVYNRKEKKIRARCIEDINGKILGQYFNKIEIGLEIFIYKFNIKYNIYIFLRCLSHDKIKPEVDRFQDVLKVK